VISDVLYWVAFREFLKSLALFSKPLVAGVHGAAVGLGVTMLPFFDMVFASDKATFYTPYAKLGQVPEGAAILTLPHMLGNAVVSTDVLVECRVYLCYMDCLMFFLHTFFSCTVKSLCDGHRFSANFYGS
jgi:1,4-dihydroxy-2-naphthoyl-CoA synthase